MCRSGPLQQVRIRGRMCAMQGCRALGYKVRPSATGTVIALESVQQQRCPTCILQGANHGPTRLVCSLIQASWGSGQKGRLQQIMPGMLPSTPSFIGLPATLLPGHAALHLSLQSIGQGGCNGAACQQLGCSFAGQAPRLQRHQRSPACMNCILAPGTPLLHLGLIGSACASSSPRCKDTCSVCSWQDINGQSAGQMVNRLSAKSEHDTAQLTSEAHLTSPSAVLLQCRSSCSVHRRPAWAAARASRRRISGAEGATMSTVTTCLLAAIAGTAVLAVMIMGRCTRRALSRSCHNGDGKATLPSTCWLLLHVVH